MTAVESDLVLRQAFVDGRWVDADEGAVFAVLDPATGETIAEVPRATAEDVDRAVQAAKKAYVEWRETTPAERAELLLKLADAIDEHTDELAGDVGEARLAPPPLRSAPELHSSAVQRSR